MTTYDTAKAKLRSLLVSEAGGGQEMTSEQKKDALDAAFTVGFQFLSDLNMLATNSERIAEALEKIASGVRPV